MLLPTRRQPYLLGTLRHLHNSANLRTAPRRSQDFGSGFSTSYDPGEELGRGPIFGQRTNKFGVPAFYPRDLKTQVDQYVVGQDRAKKTVCSVIFNHYQGLRRRHMLQEMEQKEQEKLQRQRFARDRDLNEQIRQASHPVEDEFPGHRELVSHLHHKPPNLALDVDITEEATRSRHVKVDKSNLLLIGPTGVGKTYILETLSKKLNVPFTISDCNSFTQAGYIGQDVESCIERLLVEANYDIKAAEQGIVVLDEFDKLAKRESLANGRDVGGEGVQQALLKLVEGSKVTVNVKENRSSRSATPITSNFSAGPMQSSPTPPPMGKVDQYTIDTSNILFVFCGAFVGLEKHVLRRVAKPSMGFGSEIRNLSSSTSGAKEILPDEMYAHLPHQPTFSNQTNFTPLDLTTPADLQSFGFIPELIGRMHNISALTPLSLHELFRILTEPRNSLVAQYTALFETYPSQLAFTRRALYAIAERAVKNETGARGLRMEIERVLAEPIFDAPMPYVLINEACVKGTEKAGYWGKDGRFEMERRLKEEDNISSERPNPQPIDSFSTSEELRQAGQGGA